MAFLKIRTILLQVFPVSSKVHTTRCRARAVMVVENTQLVFLDTPGVVSIEESVKLVIELLVNIFQSFKDNTETFINDDVVCNVLQTSSRTSLHSRQ